MFYGLICVMEFGWFTTGCSKLLDNRDESAGNFPAFQTGLGKLVTVKQSSIANALSVLGEDTGTFCFYFISRFCIKIYSF